MATETKKILSEALRPQYQNQFGVCEVIGLRANRRTGLAVEGLTSSEQTGGGHTKQANGGVTIIVAIGAENKHLGIDPEFGYSNFLKASIALKASRNAPLPHQPNPPLILLVDDLTVEMALEISQMTNRSVMFAPENKFKIERGINGDTFVIPAIPLPPKGFVCADMYGNVTNVDSIGLIPRTVAMNAINASLDQFSTDEESAAVRNYFGKDQFQFLVVDAADQDFIAFKNECCHEVEERYGGGHIDLNQDGAEPDPHAPMVIMAHGPVPSARRPTQEDLQNGYQFNKASREKFENIKNELLRVHPPGSSSTPVIMASCYLTSEKASELSILIEAPLVFPNDDETMLNVDHGTGHVRIITGANKGFFIAYPDGSFQPYGKSVLVPSTCEIELKVSERMNELAETGAEAKRFTTPVNQADRKAPEGGVAESKPGAKAAESQGAGGVAESKSGAKAAAPEQKQRRWRPSFGR